ncbi:MAG TPA: hypothetical protein VFW03_28420, partial [Gemmatimonadaceae bacterium]|nr:hypothetical protein [Gemmatimonadaceae bacterium]
MGHNSTAKGERREIPNYAKSRRARNPEGREIPKNGTSKGEKSARLSRRWVFRSSGFRVVRDFALFGISRRSEFSA